MIKVRLSTLVPSISGLLLVGLGCGLVIYRDGGFRRSPRAISPDSSTRDLITGVVTKCYNNEHFAPNPDGDCWLQGGPAWQYISDNREELAQLTPVAQKHLTNKSPEFRVSVYDNGYAEAVETEPWFLLNVNAQGKLIAVPEQPPGHSESLERTYVLRKTKQGWKVYQVTPLPLDTLLAGRR